MAVLPIGPYSGSGGTASKSGVGPAYVAPEAPEGGVDRWGSGQAVSPRMVRGVGVRGTVFNVTFSSVDGEPWTVYRLAAHISARRAPGVVQVDE